MSQSTKPLAEQPPAQSEQAMPSSLVSLVELLRSRHEGGEHRNDTAHWLHAQLTPFGIRVRYDQYPDPGGDSVHEGHVVAVAPLSEAELEKHIAHDAAQTQAAAAQTQAAAREEDAGSASSGMSSQRESECPSQQSGRSRRAGVTAAVSVRRGKLHIEFDDPGLVEPREMCSDGGSQNGSCSAPWGFSIGRIILSHTDGRRAGMSSDTLSQLVAECNGAVLDARTWKLLVVPPRSLCVGPPARDVNATLQAGGYDVIQVSDATVATIYSWEHPLKARGRIWCIATVNGYDVSPLQWMGEQTYAEIIYELLSEHADFVEASGLRLVRNFLCDNDVRLDFQGLDPSMCYTIGFRHPDFHPLAGSVVDPPGVWNIQGADLATGRPLYGADNPGLPHVPHQLTYDRESLAGLLRGEPTVERMARHGEGALGEAIAAISAGRPMPLAAACEKAAALDGRPKHITPLNYGFILRARDPAQCQCPDVLVQTDLLAQVRRLVYQMPSKSAREDLTSLTRMEFAAMRAYLSDRDRELFLQLFPVFAPHFKEYGALVEKVVDMIIMLGRQTSMAPMTRPADQTVPSTKIATLARAMLAFINSSGGVNVFNKDAPNIVRDYVMQREYAILLLRALRSTSRCATPRSATPSSMA
jgi:hypothetical protein